MLLLRMKRGAGTSRSLVFGPKDCDTDFNGELDLKEFRKVLRMARALGLFADFAVMDPWSNPRVWRGPRP